MLSEISKLSRSAPVRLGCHRCLGATDERRAFPAEQTRGEAQCPHATPSRVIGEGDKLLVNADKNPNSNGARLTGIAATADGRRTLRKIADGIRAGTIKTLIVFGEDVTKHGIGADLPAKLETLIVSDILPNKTTAAAHYLLPGCAHAREARHASRTSRAACSVS